MGKHFDRVTADRELLVVTEGKGADQCITIAQCRFDY
jgi:hypothetical protein